VLAQFSDLGYPSDYTLTLFRSLPDWESNHSEKRTHISAEWQEQEATLSNALLRYGAASATARTKGWEYGNEILTLVQSESEPDVMIIPLIVVVLTIALCNVTYDEGIQHPQFSYANGIRALHNELIARGYIPGTLSDNPVGFSVEMFNLYLAQWQKSQIARTAWVDGLCETWSVSGSHCLISRYVY
jgi:hypothetical protein